MFGTLILSCAFSAGSTLIPSGFDTRTNFVDLRFSLVFSPRVLSSLAGPVAGAGAPLLSSLWFPVEQRTSSTAIGYVANNMGVSLAFLIGPRVVPNATLNSTADRNTKFHQVRADLLRYMYGSFGASALVFLWIALYFPSLPPSPPSVSAGVQRASFRSGVWLVVRNRNFWILSLAYSIPNGVLAGYTSVMDVILAPAGISQETVGLIGCVAVSVSTVAALAIGFMDDKFRGRIKLFILSTYSLGALAFILFICIYFKLISSVPLLYISLCLTAVGVVSVSPLFFTMASELTFPAGEAITNSCLSFLFKLISIVFLFVLSVPGVSTSWMNWCFIGCLVCSLPLVLLFKEEYRRSNLDIRVETPEQETE